MQEDPSPETVSVACSEFEALLHDLDREPNAESRLQVALDFMEKTLSPREAPRFKDFWEVRKRCLDLFKEDLSPVARSAHWNKFSELSKEARNLKNLLDEQSDFAAEQIDIAIQALQKELEEINETILRSDDLALPEQAFSLDDHYQTYNALQKELHLLNLFAARIAALRKELIKTEMRIRTKNQFFDRLSKAGDLIFPRRKELIQEISRTFEEDVHYFVESNFVQEGGRLPVYRLRDEIKALQSAAKILTLSTQAFSSTRLKLSECWDQLKEKDKEHKEQLTKKIELSKKHAEELKGEIAAVEAEFDAGNMQLQVASDAILELGNAIQSRPLGREESKEVREVLGALRQKVHSKQQAHEEERLKQEELKLQQKRAVITDLENQIDTFVASAISLTVEEIESEKGRLLELVQGALLSKIEKGELEKRFKTLKALVKEKKEQALLTLPADERQALLQLRELLDQRRMERDEIKQQIEQLRKMAGKSGFNFGQAMEHEARVAEHRELLEKAQLAVEEIEDKIEDLETS